MFVVLLMYLVLMYQKERDQEGKKKSFFQSIAQPQLLRTSMRRPTFGIQVKQASTASLDGANKKKVQKTALLVPVERGLENMAISIC